MQPENMFVMSMATGEYLKTPDIYKPSACTPLFLSVYKSSVAKVAKASACIHTHSQAAVMVSLLYDKEFRISNIEQIKAVPRVTVSGYLDNTDELVIPIIENTLYEEDLTPDLDKILKEYPSATAVIVRRHGIYVWGENVWKAKIINEAIDYLLELAVKMRTLNIPTVGPLGVEKQSKYHTCHDS